MAESTSTSLPVRPMLGWLSLSIAAAVFALVLGLLVPGLAALRYQTTSSGAGIGSSAGGVAPWVLHTLMFMSVVGVASAVAGIVRREQPRWVHVAGVSLNIVAPVAAALTIRLLLAAVR